VRRWRRAARTRSKKAVAGLKRAERCTTSRARSAATISCCGHAAMRVSRLCSVEGAETSMPVVTASAPRTIAHPVDASTPAVTGCGQYCTISAALMRPSAR
jgi:hypothetical protein